MTLMTRLMADAYMRMEDEIAVIAQLSEEFTVWALARNTHNRKISKALCRRYAEEMKAGKWTCTGQGISFSREGWLCDGQHRLVAHQIAGYPPVKMLITFGVSAEAQINTDTHTPRSTSDVLSVAAGVNVHNGQAGVLRVLYAIESNNVITRYLPTCERVRLWETYGETIKSLWQSKEGLTSGFWGPLVYLAKNNICCEKVLEFRDGCLSGENLPKGDPRLMWRNRSAALKKTGDDPRWARMYFTIIALLRFIEGIPLRRFPCVVPTSTSYVEAIGELKTLLPDQTDALVHS